MHLLIDTNIFIYREDDRVVSQNVSDLFGLLQEIPVGVFIHPASLVDIQRDTDKRRRNVMLSKIGIYRQLQRPPSAAGDADRAGGLRGGHGSDGLHMVQPIRGPALYGTARLPGSRLPGVEPPGG